MLATKKMEEVKKQNKLTPTDWLPSLAACRAASLQTLAMSAPLIPGVAWAR